MDKNGRLSVTRKIVFAPNPKALWRSPKSGVVYPLGWVVTFPEKGLVLQINAAVKNQEMPILGPGAGIWEGMCHVTGFDINSANMNSANMNSAKGLQTHEISRSYNSRTNSGTVTFESTLQANLTGVAYMELVGYSSPAVKKRVGQGK